MNSKNNSNINPWLIAVAVILPTFMEVLDTDIVSVSLSHIAGSLAASTPEATWVSTSYLISNAIVLPASAWFSSFFGRKRFLLGCILLFTLASGLCGFANSLGMLIVSRIVQGIGGGALVPLSQAILLESFPPAKRGLAMVAYGLGVIIAPAVGPVIGGWVTDHYSWRWLFFMNLPVGVLALWLVQRFVFDPDYIRAAKPGKIDAIGFGLLTLWLGTMQTVLDKGQDADWFGSVWIRWFTVISVVAFIGFIAWELRQKEPLAELRVFKDRNFAVGTILISVAAMLVYGPITLLPMFLQGVMGYTSLESGTTQMSRGLASLLMMPLIGLIIGKMDDRKMIGSGLVLTGISALLFANLNPFFAPGQIFWPNFLQGVGMSLCMVPLMTVTMGTLKNEQMGNATGLFSLARNLAGSIGISMVTTMASRGAQTHQATLVTHLTPYDAPFQNAVQATQAALAGHVGTAQTHSGALTQIHHQMLQQANLLAYLDDFRLLGIICLVALPLVLLLKRVATKGGVMIGH